MFLSFKISELRSKGLSERSHKSRQKKYYIELRHSRVWFPSRWDYKNPVFLENLSICFISFSNLLCFYSLQGPLFKRFDLFLSMKLFKKDIQLKFWGETRSLLLGTKEGTKTDYEGFLRVYTFGRREGSETNQQTIANKNSFKI